MLEFSTPQNCHIEFPIKFFDKMGKVLSENYLLQSNSFRKLLIDLEYKRLSNICDNLEKNPIIPRY